MSVVCANVSNLSEYWNEIVLPDHTDSVNYPDDLRKAFHCAISLFHLCDWVYVSNSTQVCSHFTFNDKNGQPTQVTDEKGFAKALSEQNPNFELIRGIANSAKHLQLRAAGSNPDSPTHAANTRVQSTGYGVGGYGQGTYGGTPRVMLQSANRDLEFSTIATDVVDMWRSLGATHGWPLP